MAIDYKKLNGKFTYSIQGKRFEKSPPYSVQEILAYFSKQDYDYANDIVDYFSNVEVIEPTEEGEDLILIPSFPMIDNFYGGKWDGMMPILDFALGSGVYVAKKFNSDKSQILANVPKSYAPSGYVPICLGIDKLVEYILKNNFQYAEIIKD